jgi:hypothetical protein
MRTTTTTTFEKVLAVPLVIAALVVAVMLVRREFTDVDTPTNALTLTPLDTSEWRDLSDGPTSFGRPHAAVTIVEFGDFECPACRSFATTTLARIRSEYPTQVRLVYRHRPLAQHRFAVQAASASECARVAGRFEVMHDLLFATQDSLGLLPWGNLGLRAGLSDSRQSHVHTLEAHNGGSSDLDGGRVGHHGRRQFVARRAVGAADWRGGLPELSRGAI